MSSTGQSVLICTLGDLLLDVVVRLEQPLVRGADTAAVTRAAAGGQAANVAAWAVALGARARFVGKRAADPAGRLVTDELVARGVEVLGPEVEARNGVVVSLVDADGERTMASDRGVAPLLSPLELEMAWFRGCAWLHIAGYSLLARPIDEAAAKAAGAVRAQGGRISVDLSSWRSIVEYGGDRLRRRLEILEPDVVLANERERDALGGELPAATWVVKLGRDGCVVGRNGGEERFPAVEPVEVVDTTGAGDAFAAGFLVGGPELALAAAARCVAGMGAMP